MWASTPREWFVWDIKSTGKITYRNLNGTISLLSIEAVNPAKPSYPLEVQSSKSVSGVKPESEVMWRT